MSDLIKRSPRQNGEGGRIGGERSRRKEGYTGAVGEGVGKTVSFPTLLGSLVYADKPQTLDYLEDNIRHVIADIRPQMLEKVIENWTSRLDYIRASRSSHMPEIIFKM
ncbi:hypothetical protein TNCV_4828421 [Trichonephila clavipes]|uniref:Uncharacterized protein n=1 Tax=Trichonephila clavipes TaxID=2585209 RepID=A0A8X6SJ17_TRICX|nr:hypothetical protein TNCV_4828421 [Trichonephila clavipes]